MLGRLLAVVGIFVIGTTGANAMVVNLSIDVDSNVIAVDQYTVGEYQFRSDGTFNVLNGLNGLPDHLGANNSTSLGGFTLRRIDQKPFTILGLTYQGVGTIGGIALPNISTFETTTLLPVGPTAIVGVTSVDIELEANQIFRLAAFTTEVVVPNPMPGVPLPAAGWLLLSAMGSLTWLKRKHPTKNTRS